MQVAGRTLGDQMAVGFSPYSDSVCKDCGVIWLFLMTLDDTRGV